MLRPVSRLCVPVIICHIPLCLGSPRKGTKTGTTNKKRRAKKRGWVLGMVGDGRGRRTEEAGWARTERFRSEAVSFEKELRE